MSLLVQGNNPAAIKTAERNVFTATTNQTLFPIVQGYQVGDIDVFLNGVRLVEGDDYSASNGASVSLTSGAAVGDSVVVVCFRPFQVADFYTKSEQDTRYVNAAGDTMTGNLSFPSGTAINKAFTQATDEYILDSTHGAWNPYITFKADGGSANRGYDIGAWDNNGVKNSFLKLKDESVMIAGAGQITGAKFTARRGALSCTNNANELSGYIVFNARIQSGTNFVVATATGINSESMITAKVQYINIYDWSNSTIFHHGSRMAAIRASSQGTTTAANFSLGSQNNGSIAATEPSFYWTGTTTLNLNLTGAASNEGVAVISIAWRGCSIAVSPST